MEHEQQVYPRGCGGTSLLVPVPDSVTGLSPRVRGNHFRSSHSHHFIGSIPAGAGEPLSGAVRHPGMRVYPRGCGGTILHGPTIHQKRGLSPRVRGNRRGGRAWRDLARSIPAGAGEPRFCRDSRHSTRVYPRGCGGTSKSNGSPAKCAGLSPRVRGNQFRHDWCPEHRRSIPAGAGEPSTPHQSPLSAAVYPRGCGGTDHTKDLARAVRGLSPRVRGNPVERVTESTETRSIPAGAGEPRPARPRRPAGGVYPRGCGGTAFHSGISPCGDGLSPRVRGNRVQLIAHPFGNGSIPAGAGEPSAARCSCCR